ncbi:MAG: glycerophosphodiester phosphodiesterase [Dehalococcoidia bacterium]|nr:glycerophosphodiester phosphodiesterase [Dehalococcoidia bacterium]MCB9484842.1 glycerophosphodiester phosphodiesterase [Thermoflexaceae bacterium]
MKPLVIGHAAAAGEAPANTLAGVHQAIGARADAMEIDIQLCADGIPVLMHDLTVDRTTNLSGAVRDLPLAALQTADAGDGQPVPTLDSVLDLVAGRLTVLCELKVDHRSGETETALVHAVMEVFERRNAHAWVAVHSFDPEIVRAARLADPRVSAAIISPPVDAGGMERLLEGLLRRHGQAVSVEHHCLTPGLVMRARRRQVRLWAWTADEEEDWARLCDAGVDGIITNVPHALRAYLNG